MLFFLFVSFGGPDLILRMDYYVETFCGSIGLARFLLRLVGLDLPLDALNKEGDECQMEVPFSKDKLILLERARYLHEKITTLCFKISTGTWILQLRPVWVELG